MKLSLVYTLLFSIFITFSYSQSDPISITFTPEEQAWIEAHPKVEFGYESNWEPYEMYIDGKYTGIVGEYIREVESVTGIDLVPVHGISWEETLNQLQSGEIHVAPSCAITDDRKEYLTFTDVYITDPLIITTRKSFEFVGSLEDLYGKTIVLPKNYYTIEMVSADYPNIEIIEVNTIKECLEYVSFGKADAFIGSLGVVSYYINHKGFTNLKVAAPTKYKDTKIAFAFTQNEEWIVFRNIVQKILDQMSVQEHSEIRKKWISVRYEHGFSWEKALKYFFLFLIIISIGYLIFYLWNRSLQKQIQLKDKIYERLQKSMQRVQKQDQEKKVLLQEIHHRVKNNLQVIISMLRLQINTHKNEAIIQSLNEAIDRINAIALIHEKIYQSEQLNEVDSEVYIKELSEEIIANFGSDKKIELNVNIDSFPFDLENSLPIALIINELITNSIKHGFSNKESGQITISVTKNEDKMILSYNDNGKWKAPVKENSLGNTLIETFTEQMNGTMTFEKKEEGTFYEFVFEDSPLPD